MSPPGTGMGTTPLPSVALNQEALSSHHSWCNRASALLLLVCYVPLRPQADHPDQLNSEPFPQHLNARCLCSTDKWNYFNSHSDFFFFVFNYQQEQKLSKRAHIEWFRSYPHLQTHNWAHSSFTLFLAGLTLFTAKSSWVEAAILPVITKNYLSLQGINGVLWLCP